MAIVCLDFSKAFGMVSHSLPLEKLVCCGLGKWSVLWLGKQLTSSPRAPDMLVSCSIPNWQPVTSGGPQGSLLGSTLLPAFINDVGRRIKCTLMTFACETKLSGKMKTLKWRAILQENLDGLKERDKKNLIKFNKILHLDLSTLSAWKGN